ncbi:MAG: hypothetical protein QG650_696 [Patescibacteria group bacterium]|nr:hypothetical protein [Patescibacteria group bacterium]
MYDVANWYRRQKAAENFIGKTADCHKHMEARFPGTSSCRGKIPGTSDEFVQRIEHCLSCHKRIQTLRNEISDDEVREIFRKISHVTAACTALLSGEGIPQ